MRLVEEIPATVQEEIPTTVQDQQHDQLITVCEVDLNDQTQETLEVVVSEELLETPAKKKRKEEIGLDIILTGL